MNKMYTPEPPLRHPVFRWLERAAEQPRLNNDPTAPQEGSSNEPSLADAYPDLVDKVLRRYPEAKVYLREVIEEWWAINITKTA